MQCGDHPLDVRIGRYHEMKAASDRVNTRIDRSCGFNDLVHTGMRTTDRDDHAVGRIDGERQLTQLQHSRLIGHPCDQMDIGSNLDILCVVYSKPPFGGPESVLQYLGRYTHRVAISNHRRDSADNNQHKLMTRSLAQFLRRFLLHLLPKGFVRIRDFGFLANRLRNLTLVAEESRAISRTWWPIGSVWFGSRSICQTGASAATIAGVQSPARATPHPRADLFPSDARVILRLRNPWILEVTQLDPSDARRAWLADHLAARVTVDPFALLGLAGTAQLTLRVRW
jgi:hypothetical protein